MVVLDPLKVVITNYPEDLPEEMEIENSKEHEAFGNRKVPVSRELYVERDDFMEVPVKKFFRLYPGNEVRLKGAYFIKCNEVIKDSAGNVIELRCTYDPETRSGSGLRGRKVKGTIHWVDAKTAVPLTVRVYDYLMIEDENGENVLNPNSLKIMNAMAEPSWQTPRPGIGSSSCEKGIILQIRYFIRKRTGCLTRSWTLRVPGRSKQESHGGPSVVIF